MLVKEACVTQRFKGYLHIYSRQSDHEEILDSPKHYSAEFFVFFALSL